MWFSQLQIGNLLTVLQHLHNVLLDHGQNYLSSKTTGNSVKSTLSRHSITGGKNTH